MAIPTQIQNRIADDIALLAIDRIRAYAHRRAVALDLKAKATTDAKAREALEREEAEFRHLSQVFGALSDPDA